MNFLHKIHDFLNKEIAEENEPKETAVLVRSLCLVDIFFLLITTVYMFVKYPPRYAVLTVILLFIIFIDLFTSYKIRMHTLIGIYYMSSLVCSIYLALCFGSTPMFHVQIFIIFLLYFYRSLENSISRTISVLLSGICGLFTIFYVIENGTMLSISYKQAAFLAIINTLHILICLVIIAYFFMMKFSVSETKIMQYSKKLEQIATTDPLTKLQNRRGMIDYLGKYTTENPDSSLTLGIGDIDFFKKINDTYGHEAGDYVLETISRLMKEFMVGKGMVARWGGEEFLFSFENINGDFAFESLNKLLHILERYEFSYNGIDFKVTMTFGVEEYDNINGIEKTISKADEKLYMGKEAGRDRVIF